MLQTKGWKDSESNGRVQLNKDWYNDPIGFEQSALARGLTPVAYMQELYPHAEDPHEPKCAAEAVLEMNNIVLMGDKSKGIASSPMKRIWNSNEAPKGFPTGRLWSGCINTLLSNRYKGRNDIAPTNLDFSISDFEAGSAMRQYAVTDTRDPQRLVSFPPLSAIAANVIIQDSDVIEIPQVTYNEGNETPVKWNEGDDPNLARLTVKSSKGDSEYLQGGYEITKSLRDSSIGSDAVIMNLERQRTNGERVLVNELLTLIADGVPGMDVGLGASGDISADSIADVAMSFTEEDFVITTLIGLQDVVKRWLLADRTGFFHYGGNANMSQSILGTDTYGKAGMNRMVYDAPSSRLPANVDPGKLLGIDNRQTADVFMAAGSEANVDIYDEKTGIYYLIFRFKYGLTLRTPVDSKSRRLFS